MASNVPKFTSFRPKPKAPVEPPKAPEPSKPTKSTRKPEKPSRPSKAKIPGPAREKRDRQSEQEDQSYYIVDRKGDISNLTYGSLNRYSVPLYRRYGYGCILGVHTDRRIDRDRTTDQELVLTAASNRRQERLLTSKHSGREAGRSLRFVKATADVQQPQSLDYIALPSSRKRKREADDQSHDVDYRSIEGKRESDEPSDSDAKYESGTELDDADTAVTQQNSLLTRKTRDHPQDRQAWLDLVEHQEAMMGLGRPSFELSTSDKRHLADVRISTYEQALRNIGNDQDSLIRLHAGLLTEAILTWDNAKLTAKWVEVLTVFPKSLALWTKYLDFVETSFVSFKYESCRTAFCKSLKTLQSITDTVPRETYLYVILRLTSMIQQAGYQELAIAMWQALLEYNLLPPTSVEGTTEALRLFEEFWDSEAARIGETNAQGWRSFDGDADLASVEGPPALESLSHDIALEHLHNSEVEHMTRLKYPGRTTDEVGEDDPFHLILFSDIEDVLKVLPQDTPNLLILEAFLCFCRLPPLPRAGPHQQAWWTDPFLRHEYTDIPAVSENVASFLQSMAKFSACPISHFQMTTELLFDQGFSEVSRPVDIPFLRRILKLLVADAASDEVIGEYLLALELTYYPTEVFKTAKQLLKARPTSLRLYNAYGLVESRRGNSAKASQVFGVALSMQKGATPLSAAGSLQLFNSWVWEALRRGDKVEALWRIVSSKGETPKRPEGSSATPDQTALLRGRSVLHEANERALLGHEYSSAIMSTSLLALLVYLSDGGSPESALLIYDKLSTWLSDHKLSQTSTAELHAQSIAHFLAYHATHAPIVKPSLLRTILEPLIARFPSNTILLSLYAANEARFSIDDRVRSIMKQQLVSSSKGNNLASWFFAIHFELLRGEIAGSTSHSVRALFKKAEADSGAHSPALWRRHVLFELDEYKKEMQKRPAKKPRRDGKKRKEETLLEDRVRRVRDTFFEGLTKLPWCKEYMMLAFTHLREVLEKEDLKRVYNVMVEKELRIYVELDAAALEAKQ